MDIKHAWHTPKRFIRNESFILRIDEEIDYQFLVRSDDSDEYQTPSEVNPDIEYEWILSIIQIS